MYVPCAQTMQQRVLRGCSSPAPEEVHSAVQQSPATEIFPRRRSMDDAEGLPVYDPCSGIGKREIGRSRLAEKWVHAIPVVVLLCLFTLWWFCYPVTLETKEGSIIAMHRIDELAPNNGTHLEFAVLAAAISPQLASVPQSFAAKNVTNQKGTNTAKGFSLVKPSSFRGRRSRKGGKSIRKQSKKSVFFPASAATIH